MSQMTCDEAGAGLPELALGVLDASERAGVLAHLAGCSSCQRELERLGEVADRLIALTPGVEPPAGFESRVLATRRGPRRHRVVGLVAAAAFAVAVGVGGWAIGSAGNRPPQVAPAAVQSAQLVHDGRSVGQVLVTSGPSRWISMAMSSSAGPSGWVRCEVRESDGRTVDLGTFHVVDGYGYWAAALPGTAQVTAASVVDRAGRVIASATLPAD